MGYILSFITYKNMIFLFKCYDYYVIIHLLTTGCYLVYKIYNFGKYLICKIYPNNPKLQYKQIKLLNYNIIGQYNDWIVI